MTWFFDLLSQRPRTRSIPVSWLLYTAFVGVQCYADFQAKQDIGSRLLVLWGFVVQVIFAAGMCLGMMAIAAEAYKRFPTKSSASSTDLSKDRPRSGTSEVL